jgi:hypothetical protein
MKQLFGFFIGILLICIMGAVLFFTGTVYDTAAQIKIEPYMMQPNNETSRRIGAPLAADEISDRFMRERLIRKFVMEYFYAVPDADNIARRRRNDSIMWIMAAPAVFDEWRDGMAGNIDRMANEKKLRTIVIADEILMPPNSDYWEVFYELTTWDKPNDIDLIPVRETGAMYLRVNYAPGIRTSVHGNSFNANKYLERGGDPAGVFNVVVEEVK